jgi:hypothetical protein
MSAAANLSAALRAVADRVEKGESFPSALREVASELESRTASIPAWHLAAIDLALADGDDADEQWEVSLAQVRDQVSQP